MLVAGLIVYVGAPCAAVSYALAALTLKPLQGGHCCRPAALGNQFAAEWWKLLLAERAEVVGDNLRVTTSVERGICVCVGLCTGGCRLLLRWRAPTTKVGGTSPWWAVKVAKGEAHILVRTP